MSKIVQFPTKDARLEQLRGAIDKKILALESRYAELDDLHAQINSLESDCNDNEKEFDGYLKEYIYHVGVDNVPATWLSYSQNCIIKAIGEGEYKMVWLGNTDAGEEYDE